MVEKSRTRNAFLNIFFGFAAQIGIVLLSFLGRRIFLHFLTADYLGVNGLFTNILTVLSLGELGLDMVAAYSLYKPVAENDLNKIRSLVFYFRKVYFVLAAIILAVGVGLIPFLGFLVKSELPLNEVTFYYLLFLLNSVLSYFVAHKVVLLSAYQEQRIHKIVTLSANLILQLLHIVVLLIWGNFYVYILSTLLSTIAANVILSVVCSKIHADVFCGKETVDFDKKAIRKSFASAFLYKLGAVLVSSTDNILISIIVSTAAVGYYSNYLQVVTAVQSFIAVITLSMVAGIGNMSVKATCKEQEEIFDMLLLFYHFIAAIGLIGFSLLFNNLICLWLGSQYTFDTKTVVAISCVFYLTNAISPVWMIREANGIFDSVKYVLLVRAFLNLTISILLGLIFGTFGIFLATIISLLLTSFIVEPRIVSRRVLKRSTLIYWKKQLKYFLLTVVSFALCYLATRFFDDSTLMFLLKAVVIIVITTACFFIVNFKTKEFKKLVNYFLKAFKKKRVQSNV